MSRACPPSKRVAIRRKTIYAIDVQERTMKERVLVAVCLLLAVSALAGVLYQTGDVPADETVTHLNVEADGDAVFVLEVRTILDTDDKRESFDAFAQEVEEDPESAVSDFRESVEPLVERAGDETGREMSASNFTVETRVEPFPVERGVVEYRFDWEGFAESDDEIRAGDVLSGYILSEGDALVFNLPDGYEVSSANPTPDTTEGEVRWNGPRDFSDDQPRAVFAPESNQSGVDGGANDGVDDNASTGADGEDAGESTDEGGIPLYAYAVALVVLISVAAVVYHGRSGSGEREVAGDTSAEGKAEAQEQETGFAREKVPDDERVLDMIESEGGRMKQKRLVEETGWSEAKVSKLTSSLEEEDEITKIRLGRENILEIKEEEEAEDGDDYRPNL